MAFILEISSFIRYYTFYALSLLIVQEVLTATPGDILEINISMHKRVAWS